MKPGDRVYVIDPGLAELRAIFKKYEGYEKPNHHGTVDEVVDGVVFINFDDGGEPGSGACAPYPVADVRLLP